MTDRGFAMRASAAVVLVAVTAFHAFAGDSLYGKVTAVKTAVIITFDWLGGGQHVLRLAGIDVPKEGPIAVKAREFVEQLVLDKNARMRLERRLPTGQLLSRLFTDDPVIGIKDVGLELVKAGLARRIDDSGYKYGELATAEREARAAKRGLWAQ